MTRLCLLVLVTLGCLCAAAPSARASRVAASAAGVRPDADRIVKARALAAEGKVPEAEKLLNSAIESEKDHERRALLRFTLAVIEFRAANDDAARTLFKAAIDDGTRLQDYAHYYLGLIEKKQKDTGEARTEFQRVIDSRTSKATELDARFELAQLLLNEKQWKPAIVQLDVLRKGLKSDERYAEVLYDILHAQLKQGARSAGLCKTARELYSKYPTFAMISGASGTDGVWGSALDRDKIDGQTLSCHADARDLKLRVRRLWLGGDDARAEAELRLLHGDPDDEDEGPVVDRLLVNHLIADGRLDEALKLLLQHYDAGKNRPGYLQLLAKTAGSAGENQVAVSAYQRAFDLAPRTKDGLNSLFQAAFTSYQMQDYDGASRRFEQFLRVQPKSALARDSQWYLAWIRYLRGDYQGAIDSFAQLSHVPQTRRVRRRRRGRHGSTVILASSDTVAKDRIQYWTAMSYLKMGQVPSAIPLFQSLARDPAIGYYSMLAYYHLLALPGGKIPGDIDLRLGLRHSGGGAPPSEEELKAAAQNATEEAQAEYDADTVSAEDPSEEVAADPTAETPAVDATPDGTATADATKPDAAAPTESAPPANFKDPQLAIRFERARDLALVGLTDGARRELLDIERHARSTADRHVLMVEYANVQNYERSSFLGEIAFGSERLRTGLNGDSRPYWEQAYPRAWESSVTTAAHTTAVPEQLIWGIMRAESHYRDDARSPVGALGLMQMMPFTGKKVADLLNWKSFETRNLLEPETNIRLGSRYLQRLAEKFGGKVPLVAASYNAGPHRVSAWIRNFGTLDMDEFIEHIPYVETRNYVKRVVRNFQIYNLLYQGDAQALKWVIQPIGLKATETTAGVQEIW